MYGDWFSTSVTGIKQSEVTFGIPVNLNPAL